MRINAGCSASQMSRQFLTAAATTLILTVATSAHAQCSSGGRGTGMAPPAGGQMTAGGTTAGVGNQAGLLQMAAMAQQAQQLQLLQQQRQMRMAFQQRQQQVMWQQQAATRVTDSAPARAPRSDSYAEAAQRRRAAYLHTRGREVSETSMQSLTLAGR